MIANQKRECKEADQTWQENKFYSNEKLIVEQLYRSRDEEDTETPAEYVPK